MKKLYYILGLALLATSVWLFFIPAFQGHLLVSPVITIGAFELRWYGLIIGIAILAAYLVSRKYAWRFGISQEDIDDFTFWAVIFGIIGARAYYVLFNISYFSTDWIEVLKIWHGGLSIYGGIIGGALFAYIYTRKKAYTFNQLFDVVALGLPLGQAVGRLGNFFNQEAFGGPTNLAWKMFVEPQHRPVMYSQNNFFHPAFAYEIIANLIIFFILQRLLGKGRSGTIGWTYLGLYSLVRFFIEAIRVDSFFVNGLRADQVVSVVVLLISGIMIMRKR